jgi:hypothetical protein
VPGPENASCGISLRDAVRCVAMVGAGQRAHRFSCHSHDGAVTTCRLGSGTTNG